MKKLRAAVLGVGYLGQFHAQKFKACPSAELVGVYDANPERAQKIAQDLGVQAFTQLDQLQGAVDVVSIAAVTRAHYELAAWCMNHGLHVLVEKPITATLAEGEKILSLAKKNNLKLSVGHIERFNPCLKELLKVPLKPEMLILRREGPFKTRAADVSVLHDLMIHDVDLLTWITKSDIKSFHVEKKKVFTETWDWAEVHVQMENGMLGILSSSRISVTPQRSLQLVRPGETLWGHLGTNEISHCKATPQGPEPVDIKTWTLEKQDALQFEINAFVDCVKNDTSPAVTGEDGLKALAWIEKWSN